MSGTGEVGRAGGASLPAGHPAASAGPSRRAVLAAAGAALVAAGCGEQAAPPPRPGNAYVPLLSDTVALYATGRPALVPAGRHHRVHPGSRVLRAAPAADELLEQEQAWLAAGASWTRPAAPWGDLATDALLDLRALLPAPGVSVAGWSRRWRYVWPRDASHVAAALAATGHVEDALPVLAFLQQVQRPDGWFEARYLPDGSGPPDARPRQLDGSGWVLWAAARVAAALPAGEAAERLAAVRTMLVRCTRLILRLTDNASALPPPSPDYWEIAQSRLTLGTAAPLAAGLSSAPAVLALVGEDRLADAAARGARRLRAGIDDAFGRVGYTRHVEAGKPDASVAFLLPPYTDRAEPAVLRALGGAALEMRRPAGGLAPGAGWRQDGISWTPQTALFALAAASTGDRTAAYDRLRWLAAHRTPAGSLPEKVLADGRPASVAPLAWTAAYVLLTLAALR